MSTPSKLVEEIAKERYASPTNSDRLFVAKVMRSVAEKYHRASPTITDLDEYIQRLENESRQVDG